MFLRCRNRISLLLVAVMPFACGGEGQPVAPAPVPGPFSQPCVDSWQIAFSSGYRTLEIGEKAEWYAQLRSSCLMGGGWTKSVTWQSLNPDIVEVSPFNCIPSGYCDRVTVSAKAAGTATIIATDRSNTQATVDIVVLSTQSPPVRIRFEPIWTAVPFAPPEQHFSLAAYAEWPGRVVDVTPLSTWNSDDPAVASVSSGGMVSVSMPGRTVIRATFRGLVGEMPLEILDPGRDGVVGFDQHDLGFRVMLRAAYSLASAPAGTLLAETRDQKGRLLGTSDHPAVTRGARSVFLEVPLPSRPPDVTALCTTVTLLPTGGTPTVSDVGCIPSGP